MGSVLKMLELFSGIGGFRRGFESAGHTCIDWVEIDKYARKSYEAIWPEAKEEWSREDITAVKSHEIPMADVWCFGSPCQDLSAAGRRAGLAGSRSGLFLTVVGLLSEIREGDRPEWILFENVEGILSSNRGWDFLFVQTELAEVGYDTEYEIFNATQFEIPQNRRRLFLVGHLRIRGRRKILPLRIDGDENQRTVDDTRVFDFHSQTNEVRVYTGIVPTCSGIGTGGSNKPMIESTQLKELTCDVADAFRVYDARGIARTQKAEGGGAGAKTGMYQVGVVRKVEDGETSYSERETALCIDANYYKGLDAHQARTGVAVYQTSYRSGELEYEEVAKDVSPTLGAQHSQSQVPCISDSEAEIGTRIRRLTPKEVWRLFGREDWEFERAKAAGVSDSQLYKQAGNSLVPQIVEAIARRLS